MDFLGWCGFFTVILVGMLFVHYFVVIHKRTNKDKENNDEQS